MIYKVIMKVKRLGPVHQHAGWISAENDADAEVKGHAKVKECLPYCGPATFVSVESMTDEQVIDSLDSFAH